ncbi:hypothetical protein ACFSTC_20380 [Nonomuraea ferruginea]
MSITAWPLDHGGDRVRVGHRDAAELLDLLDHDRRAVLLHPVPGQGRAHVVDDHLRTAAPEFESVGPAEPSTCSRDDGDTTVEAEIHGNFLLLGAGHAPASAPAALLRARSYCGRYGFRRSWPVHARGLPSP